MNTLSTLVTPDEQLWQMSLAGDREAFGQIVERHQSLICALAYCACGDLGRAEDLAQETFLAAWQSLAELREPTKLRTWLCGIVRNLAADAARRDFRRGTPESLEVVGEPISPEGDPAAQAVTQEEAALLWHALAGLPELYREPLVLFYREQQSVKVVATGLDLTEDVVRQRLSRGRAMLREEMTELLETTLTRTRPGAVFTIGVLAALSLVSPPTAGAAATGGAVAGKGATALAKGAVSGVGPSAIAGPGAGLLVGWLATTAVRLTARSERERICVTRHCRRMVLYSFSLCALLVLTLSQAGELYPATIGWMTFGILAWVGVLVATILGINARMQREVQRIRAETGTKDTTGAN
ncbi:MAG TPA: sigma-70 family RNA polymerase sigma factor [Candidatus Nitrosotalea sp.]|nr:sigma-70 family RNA polymerase sigma factor [Candidatus Nitrosotalea sp.]